MIFLSRLNKTWLIDVDGTIVKHNGYLNGNDELLSGAKEYFGAIPPEDKIILLTSRKAKYKEQLEFFLRTAGIRFDQIIFDLPVGERILVNDNKPSGLPMAFAFNKKRDESLEVNWSINEEL